MATITEAYAAYPPATSKAQQHLIVQRLKDYALSQGFAVKPAAAAAAAAAVPAAEAGAGAGAAHELPSQAVIAPITIYPSLFPRSCFDEALAIQQDYNLLYARIADDEAWLRQIVPKLAELDDFVQNLWQIHLDLSSSNGYTQSLSLGLFRSDYMVHLDQQQSKSKPQIRQVEFNTIASSFGGLSTRAALIHRHLAASKAYHQPETPGVLDVSLPGLPESEAASALAQGLAAGYTAYVATAAPKRPSCVVFVVQAQERNVFDQKHIENALVDQHEIPVFRVIFDSISQTTSIDSETSALLYADPISDTVFEVAVIYYRAGYSPGEYTAPQHWSARRELERSRAIKCPTVLTQLAGMKKVQQVLAAPNSSHLNRFLPDVSWSNIDALHRTFAPMYPLDDTPAGVEGRQLATTAETARRFVLKPQREGGGNNIYRTAIPPFLKTIPQQQWDAYILMEMIEPPAQRNAIVRDGGNVIEEGGVICELGVYGTCLWRRPPPQAQSGNQDVSAALDPASQPNIDILHNATAGYLLRTKGDQSEEGGVAAGFGALDSPLLVDF